MLLARIYEAFPLAFRICHAEMRIIAFINEAATVKKILDLIGEVTQPPRIAPARGPPLWMREQSRGRGRRSSSISASLGSRTAGAKSRQAVARHGVTRA